MAMQFIGRYKMVLAAILILGVTGAVTTHPMPLRMPGGKLHLVEEGLIAFQERFVVRVPEDFTTIQAAIDAVAEGGTVLIGPGLYKENVKITKSVRVVGAGQEQVHVRAVKEQQPTIYVEALLPIQIHLEGFTIGDPTQSLEELPRLDPTQLSYPLMPAGIQAQGAVQAELHKLNIGCQGAGIFTKAVFIAEELFLAPHLMLSEVELAHNAFGLFMMSSNLIIQRSTIRENLIGVLNVLLQKSGELTLYKSTLVSNLIAAVALSNRYQPQGIGYIIGNEIVGNGGGIYLAASQPGSWVEIANNQISRNLDYGIAVMQSVCPSDFRPLLAPLMVSESAAIQILGRSNKLLDNSKGDLCPPDYPWPPGFRK
jgi:hypothetical protein